MITHDTRTLHMGATRTAPSQYSGFFLCNRRATAPPIDSPNKILIFFRFSLVSIIGLKWKNKVLVTWKKEILEESKKTEEDRTGLFLSYHKHCCSARKGRERDHQS